MERPLLFIDGWKSRCCQASWLKSMEGVGLRVPPSGPLCSLWKCWKQEKFTSRKEMPYSGIVTAFSAYEASEASAAVAFSNAYANIQPEMKYKCIGSLKLYKRKHEITWLLCCMPLMCQKYSHTNKSLNNINGCLFQCIQTPLEKCVSIMAENKSATHNARYAITLLRVVIIRRSRRDARVEMRVDAAWNGIRVPTTRVATRRWKPTRARCDMYK